MVTPMLKQYNEMKKQYNDCLLLFRLGDFYEAFQEDARILSKILGITLTGRGKGESRIPMAGIPYHALDKYLPMIIDSGNRIAIADQVGKVIAGQIVKRRVVKVITAGTITNATSLDAQTNSFLACIYKIKVKSKYIWGISIVDITTGDFFVFEINSPGEGIPKDIVNEINRFGVNEILVSENHMELKRIFFDKIVTEFDDTYLDPHTSTKIIQTQLGVNSLKGFGIEHFSAGLVAAAEVIEYIHETQKTDLNHITKISELNINSYMKLDIATIKNLELLSSTNNNQDATLYHVMNDVKTPMGQRLLKRWLYMPLIDKVRIEKRSNTVDYFVNDSDLLSQTRKILTDVYDIDRILGRIGLSSANARDLKALSFSLQSISKLGDINFKNNTIYLKILLEKITNCSALEHIIHLVESAIKENPPVAITESGIIKEGFDSKLDDLRDISSGGKNKLIEIQKSEIQRTGIKSLKVKFNNVFGYYIEVSKVYLEKVPDNYIRKQTLVNVERFITNELKTMEVQILGAQEKIINLEYELFKKIRDEIAEFISPLQEVSKSVAILDILTNFAWIALDRHYTKPKISLERKFNLVGSRHPVIEYLSNDQFIPNDLEFSKNEDVMILTGPNMAGKSTYIRQVALISILAHIGSFVPARIASIPLLDRVFTRVGASDNLVSGESTFMVEMNETANILNNATKNSLIILDEVGRGTSTYDGISIAWAITEYIHNIIGAFTLFATHYQELTQLQDIHERIANYNVVVCEDGDDVTFMRKIEKGGTSKSYGIYVGKLAGLPKVVIDRANSMLHSLESKSTQYRKNEVQFSFMISPDELSNVDKHDALIEIIDNIDINNITPIDAFKKIQELKDLT